MYEATDCYAFSTADFVPENRSEKTPVSLEKLVAGCLERWYTDRQTDRIFFETGPTPTEPGVRLLCPLSKGGKNR